MSWSAMSDPEFAALFHYVTGDCADEATRSRLLETPADIEKDESRSANRLFYLATPPTARHS